MRTPSIPPLWLKRLFLELVLSWPSLLWAGQGRSSGPSSRTYLIVAGLCKLLLLLLACCLLLRRLTRKARFSRWAVVAPWHDAPHVLFRFAGPCAGPVEVRALLSREEPDEEDHKLRRAYELPLTARFAVGAKARVFGHRIDAHSPLWGMGPASLARADAEIVIVIRGAEQGPGSTLSGCHTYAPSEIVWDSRFLPLITALYDCASSVNVASLQATLERDGTWNEADIHRTLDEMITPRPVVPRASRWL